MPAHRLDGKAIAEEILIDLKRQAAALPTPPGLAAILIGNDPASALYVKNKEKACLRVGVTFHKYLCNEQCMADADQPQVIAAIKYLNRDPGVTGIIIQLPVPAGFDANALVQTVDPTKDVDGFHPANVQRFLAGTPYLTPPVVAAVLRLLEAADVRLEGGRVAVVAKDGLLRKLLGKTLVDAGAHVAVTLPETNDFRSTLQGAEVVITVIGKPGIITGDDIKKNAVVIDVGISRLPDGSFRGDVDAATVEQVAAAYTPTPGGVGPLTVAMLLKNVSELATRPPPG